MKLENQVCSLELSKKLRELGVKQENLWYWCEGNSYGADGISMYCGTYGIISKELLEKTIDECKKINSKRELKRYSAFTVAELGEMLPYVQFFWSDKPDGRYTIIYEPSNNYHTETDSIEANARAKMLIWLTEKEFVK